MSNWKRMVVPPHGGLSSLRERLDREERQGESRHARLEIRLLAGCAAALSLAFAVFVAMPSERGPGGEATPDFPAKTGLRVERGHAVEIPVADARVRLYWMLK